MKRTATILSLLGLTLALAAPVQAQLVIGGHNETSENFSSAYVIGVPTPGGGIAGGANSHLLISEVVVTPTAGEYIEICNGTGASVDLSKYYLSDDWFATTPNGYYKLPQAGYVTAVNSDFIMKFPTGTIMPAGAVWTIAVDGAAFLVTYATAANFEIRGTDAGVPDMVNVGGNVPDAALITNASEVVVLFFWDGASDNVCDIDMCQWGVLASGNAVDKTGQSVDGPDGDAIATAYNADLARASQTFGASPGSAGQSLIRQACVELVETANSNGCVSGGPTATSSQTWGRLKTLYR